MSPRRKAVRQGAVAALGGQGAGLLGGLHRLGEAARLGVGRGERVKKPRLAPAGKPGRPLGQLHRLEPVPQRGIRRGCQQPGQASQRPGVVGMQSDRLLKMGDCLVGLPAVGQRVSQQQMCVRAAPIDVYRFAEIVGRLVESPAEGEVRAQTNIAMDRQRIDVHRLPMVFHGLVELPADRPGGCPGCCGPRRRPVRSAGPLRTGRWHP